MSRKWSGKRLSDGLSAIALAFFMLGLVSCTEKIPGNPKKVVTDYVTAVQKNDFDTIYKLNRVTARNMKYLQSSEVGDIEEALRQTYNTKMEEYNSVAPTFTPGVQWAEKHFFPKSARITYGEPYQLKPVGDDPVNAEYEKALTAMIPVYVEYTDKTVAPEHEGKKIKTASYTCSVGKIRGGMTVRVYNVDANWYFNGCIIDRDSLQYF